MEFVDDFEEYVLQCQDLYDGDIELGEPISHDVAGCKISDCVMCTKMRRIRDKIHEPTETSSLYEDTTMLMGKALTEKWTVETTIEELTKLKAFHDTMWFELKRAVFESLLNSIPHSSLGGIFYPKSRYFYEKFEEIVVRWRELISLVFPPEYVSDIPDYLCIHLSKPNYTKWCDRSVIVRSFQLLLDQKLVSSKALIEWYREECQKKYETTIFQHTGGSGVIHAFINSLPK